MITPGLERVIQMGKARAHTFTYGAGGVGRIPVPKNSFIVIHHFDYWHFLDVPPSEDSPAVGGLIVSTTDITIPAFTATFDFGIVGNFVATVDFANPAATLLSVQTALTLMAPGWTVSLISNPAKLQFTFTTTTPGTTFNGITITFTPTIPQPTVASFATPFAGGSSAIVSAASFLQHSTHQLEFRSTKGRNHFVIQEPVVVFPIQASPPPIGDGSFFAYMDGTFYPKDCYLVHTESVQMNVVGVPPVESWGITYSAVSDKAQEFPLGVGYGSAGVPSAPTVREVFFDGGGLTQQYLPLTAEFENIAAVAGQYRGEFKVDVNLTNALFNPINRGGIYGNWKTYPLINIDYVQVDMNYNEFVKASNG